MADMRLVFYSNAKYMPQLPPWLELPAEIHDYPVDFEITLDEHATPLQAELFLLELNGFDDFTGNASDDIRRLLAESEPENLIVSGGVVFFDESTAIPPSCCCGVEAWAEIYDEVSAGNSPWMGHDPYPLITFHEENATVWSHSDYDTSQPLDFASSITYSRQELLDKVEALGEKRLFGFLEGPFRKRIQELASGEADALVWAVRESMCLTL